MVNPFLNRRKFIGATAVASAGLLLNSCKSDSDQKTSTARTSPLNTLNIALIGYGEEGKVLLESILSIEGVRLVALCDIWDYHLNEGARYLEKIGNPVRTYENYEDLLAKEKDLQAVVIATPDFCHATMTNTCLKAGLHVYCEKMMSNTIEGARSMVQTMRATGKLLQIGHQRRSNPRYLFTLNRCCMRRSLRPPDGSAGQWNRAVKEDFAGPKSTRWPPASSPNTAIKTCTSSATGAGTRTRRRSVVRSRRASDRHIQLVAGHPKSVIGSGGLDYYKNHDWYDNAIVITNIVGPGGGARVLSVQTTTSAGGGYFEMFMGDDGTIKMSEDRRFARFTARRAPPRFHGRPGGKGICPRQGGFGSGRRKSGRARDRATGGYEIPVFFNKHPISRTWRTSSRHSRHGKIELPRR